MKKLLVLIITTSIASTSAFSASQEEFNERISPNHPATKHIVLENNEVLIEFPILKILQREATGDAVYFGRFALSKNICKKYGYSSFVRGSKKMVKARAVSTTNLGLNTLMYNIDPTHRLSTDYKYPKTVIVKSLKCKID